MTWFYRGEPFTSDDISGYHSFVYRITDKETGRFYVGKKIFFNARKLPPLKGQKRKRTVVKESDWLSYFGSNETLKALVEKHGSERFRREILHLCKSKGEASFMEAYEQFAHDVLRRDDCFNDWIIVKVHRKHLK
ncbi:hypothetical protein [Sinorhizobium meliloti]|uniref:hypothetical protein n=1 Tax=Rhizobium meliloti TaxID=382 RepID=UPI000FD75734|nr:hypothetical protein [Sinorhizobium meliloti]MDX0197020.1 hypothetical protein [Sinorhizobium meliloti]MDX0370602.1 hypothetical protein [Sinorhizobium meliloti]RVM26250.1 hypothetical protein CN132_16440 [Sinorhizobium meliloti]